MKKDGTLFAMILVAAGVAAAVVVAVPLAIDADRNAATLATVHSLEYKWREKFASEVYQLELEAGLPHSDMSQWVLTGKSVDMPEIAPDMIQEDGENPR